MDRKKFKYDSVKNIRCFIDCCVACVGIDKTMMIVDCYKDLEDQIEAGVLQDYPSKEESTTKDFYTIKEFSKKMNVHAHTIRNSIRQGKLSAFRLTAGKNSAYRIPAAECHRLAEVELKVKLSDLKDCD